MLCAQCIQPARIQEDLTPRVTTADERETLMKDRDYCKAVVIVMALKESKAARGEE